MNRKPYMIIRQDEERSCQTITKWCVYKGTKVIQMFDTQAEAYDFMEMVMVM